ncbi:MAG: leucine-rich repeat domain-containing protein [Ruminococcaceae bacterium]|nr:leucine-rich repeat domain-containing protein [Oscillospiraceae bacterium]
MNYDNMFEFEKTDGGYSLKNYLLRDNDSVTEIEIPSEYLGKPVVKIGERAFFLLGIHSRLRSVHIPDSVTEICSQAFAMTDLEQVNIPRRVTAIGNSAFVSCHIGTVDFPEGLRTIDAYAFQNCQKLRSVIMPDSLENVGKEAFMDCFGLRSVVFQNPRTRLGEQVFHRCELLPAETMLMSLAGSADISSPIKADLFGDIWESPNLSRFVLKDMLRADVFPLLIEKNAFRSLGRKELSVVFKQIIEDDFTEYLSLALVAGLLADSDLADELIDFSMELNKVEITAWLLDYKNKNIGFSGNNYEL